MEAADNTSERRLTCSRGEREKPEIVTLGCFVTIYPGLLCELMN